MAIKTQVMILQVVMLCSDVVGYHFTLPENRGGKVLPNVDIIPHHYHYTVSQPTRL